MISTDRVVLGPLKPSDFESLFRWSNSAEIARMNETMRPNDWQSQHERWMNAAKDNSRVIFAIRRPNEVAILGFVQISNIDPTNHAAILGITIGEPVNRGQGLGTDAIKLAVDYCWNNLNLSRIALTVFAHNIPAVKLYERAGFKREGRLQRAMFIDGNWIDVLVMAALHPRRRNPPKRKSPSPLH